MTTVANAVPPSEAPQTVEDLLANVVRNFHSNPEQAQATAKQLIALQNEQETSAEGELRRLEAVCESWGTTADHVVAHVQANHASAPAPTSGKGKGKGKAPTSTAPASATPTGKELMDAAAAAGQDMSTNESRQPLFRAVYALQQSGDLIVAEFKRGDTTVYLNGK